jgi:hypothetical protein
VLDTRSNAFSCFVFAPQLNHPTLRFRLGSLKALANFSPGLGFGNPEEE